MFLSKFWNWIKETNNTKWPLIFWLHRWPLIKWLSIYTELNILLIAGSHCPLVYGIFRRSSVTCQISKSLTPSCWSCKDIHQFCSRHQKTKVSLQKLLQIKQVCVRSTQPTIYNRALGGPLACPHRSQRVGPRANALSHFIKLVGDPRPCGRKETAS